MKYVKFHIENYKAVDNADIDVSRNLIPLIGINESGKTTILHAILAFDKDKDHVLDGYHLQAKNKYKSSAKRKECSLVAYVKAIDDDEASDIIRSANVKTGSALYQWCEDTLMALKPIAVKRDVEHGEFKSTYHLVDAPAVEGEVAASKRLVNEVIRRLPNILYFDDFSDRVPSEIAFPGNYPKDQQLRTRGQTREWQEIVHEVFDRALEGDLTLKDFFGIEDADERNDTLDEVAEVLNAEIVQEWKNLKKAHAAFGGEEPDTLQLRIESENSESEYVFKFKVVDTEQAQHNRRFDVVARSKGFQWFFNFIMKLKFNPKYKEHPDDAVYLLDEPGSYLHASAQEELLKKLLEISKTNTILYCTHSQYLLDPEIVNINDVRVVSKEEGSISVAGYGESDTPREQGAYSALRDALHLKYAFPIDSLRHCLLVEGISDWCFFKLFGDLNGVTVIPGAGASQLKQMISILIASSDSFCVLLDKDKEGNKAFTMYSDAFGEAFTKNAFQYPFPKHKKFVLEDFLEPEDVAAIKTLTGASSVKKGIIKLYYSPEEVKGKLALSAASAAKVDLVSRKIKKCLGVDG